MEDRLKFRFWREKENDNGNDIKALYYPDFMTIDGEAEPYDNSEGGASCEYRQCICEQCTGVKDKNGILIYEGDIVTKSYITPDGRVTSENDPSFIKAITFFKGCFGIFGKTNFHPIIEYIDYHQGDYISNAGNVTIYDDCFLEVIGNIHENPEVLKGDY